MILIPARNEEVRIPTLLTHLKELEYPNHKRMIVIINDGSIDRTQQIIQKWARRQENVKLLSLPKGLGKAQAINTAVKKYAFGEYLIVFDADERPESDSLNQLIHPFEDPDVGAVSGLRVVANALQSPISSYIAIESLVHQWVTMRGKDKLGLNPAILGSNCAYRRKAFEELQGFTQGFYLEDTDITVKLSLHKWKTRFILQAKSTHEVPSTIRGYWQQHTRWATGFGQVSMRNLPIILFNSSISWLQRLELGLFTVGYLDRVIVFLAVGYHIINQASLLLSIMLLIHLATPFIQALTAIQTSRASRALRLRLFLLPAFYILDIAMAITGLVRTMYPTNGVWRNR
ncbi:MAG: glycosyltransferase family 2 protein [Anaerolineae bacterium]|nr:glycosyltransferase family 2 protein [Anaerolineae bacterium]